MYSYNNKKSFIAELHSTTADYEGRVGSIILSNDRTNPTFGSWLTLSDHNAQRQAFWFGYFQDAFGNGAFEIRTYFPDSKSLHNKRLDWNTNRYIGLYEPASAPGPFFSLDREINGAGKFDGVVVLSENKRSIKPYAKEERFGNWFAYLKDEQGPDLRFTLDVQRFDVPRM
ncbi:hypothetical protein D3C76_297240 [compost metagenome]